ncbi:thioesterase superfamily protein [Oleiphilus messinensis]|uniref:Thioesterase superfamily protein n=1 Tax=Oleiphilus messinensis TaxID=141451 RepID=A0A1Y0I7Y4_9GAMM|nr:YbgC/FadM family acyl-CoA thioesterase [Oleiphilus messinensis]ARU56608.1 thioesterase superfamily protein [Oleiphilus messinensis]
MSPFSLPIRVYIEDTDAGGIVFYANYLKFMERARTEFVRNQGVALRRELEGGVNFVVANVNVNYLRSAFLDDLLLVTAEVKQLARTYMVFGQTVLRSNTELSLDGVDPSHCELLVKGEIKVACVDQDTGKPRRLPKILERCLVS